MNIGFISTRLAGLDGVSLEAAKLAYIFRELGHQVFYCAGELDADGPPGRMVPEMHFTHPDARKLHDEAFRAAPPEPAIFNRIYKKADYLREQIGAFVDDHHIDVLLPQNACSIPMNLSLGVAITEYVKRTRIHTLCHHHDFYWERSRFFINHGMQSLLDDAFPPKLEPIRHLVISTVMQQRFYAWRGIYAQYLPNVFHFESPPPPPDDYANSFRAELGLSQDDLIVLQPTRVIRRKMIEKSIELLRRLNDRRLVLLVTGYEGDEPGGYGAWLREEAERWNVRCHFIADYVGDERGVRNGHKVFKLWDIYPHAHFVTYPSEYEGFGNALIETLYFRKPVVVHTYPVYLSDIKPVGVRAVEFNYDFTPEAVEDVRQIIDDASLRDKIAEHNYAVGLVNFSYTVLRRTLTRALESFYADPF